MENSIYFLGVCILVYIAFKLDQSKKTDKPSDPENYSQPNPPKENLRDMVAYPNSVYPRYYTYKGGFANVTKCNDCNSVGLYEDQHIVEPCNACGGKVQEFGAAEFSYKHHQWFKKKA